MNHSSHKNDWKMSLTNNKAIALNIFLHAPYNSKKIRSAYFSKHNLKLTNQVILLTITDGKKRHYLAVKKLSALFKRIISNHDGDFYCLNCIHSPRTKINLKNIKMYVKIIKFAINKCLKKMINY